MAEANWDMLCKVRMMHKTRVREIVCDLSDDVDVDELTERLYLLRKIDIAEEQIARGEVLSHEELLRQVAEWRK